MIVVGARVVIPKSMCAETLRSLVAMHQGVTKTRQRARVSVYWPNMDVDIANATQSCEDCTRRLPSLPSEPLKQHPQATRPFEHIHADIGTDKGRDFLVIVDSYSGWLHVVAFPDKNTTARRIIDTVRLMFSNVGAPVTFWSDNGPQFASAEFKTYLTDWGVNAVTSSPYYAASNGRGEAEINTMKSLVEGAWKSGTFNLDKFAKSLLMFRNAPRSGGASPAEVVFGKPVRDLIPAHRRSFSSEWQRSASTLEKRACRSKELQVEHFNKKTRPLTPFSIGNYVIIQHPTTKRWSTPGVVVEVGPHRDYLVKTPAGRVIRRNRRFLRRRVPMFGNPSPGQQQPHRDPDQQQPQPGPGQQQPRAEPVQQKPAVRRSARVRQPKRLHFPNEWSQ